jgi:hypothetical protein
VYGWLGRGPLVGDLGGGAWPQLGDGMTDDEAVVCPARGGGRGGGGLPRGNPRSPSPRLSTAGGLALGCGVSGLHDLLGVSGGNHGQLGMVAGVGARPE